MNNPVVKKISAIVIGIVIFVGLVFGYFTLFGTRAADFEPRDVIVSNIEKNSVKATWSTGVDTQGVIEYGTTPTALNFFAPEPAKTKTHSLDLTLLSPSTTYYFDVRVGDTKYDNGGVPWTFTTKSAEASVNSPARPTAVPTQVGNPTLTPVQRLKISDGTNCIETVCAQIKLKIGKGCSIQDYFKCLRKLTPTP